MTFPDLILNRQAPQDRHASLTYLDAELNPTLAPGTALISVVRLLISLGRRMPWELVRYPI